MPYSPSQYFTQYCSWSRNSVHSKRNVAMSLFSWNSLVLPCSSPSWKQVPWQNGRIVCCKLVIVVPASWQYLAGLEEGSLEGILFRRYECVYALNQCPIYGNFSPTGRTHKVRNLGVEIGVTPLPLTFSDSLAKFLSPDPMTWCPADLEVLVPKGRILSVGDTMIL